MVTSAPPEPPPTQQRHGGMSAVSLFLVLLLAYVLIKVQIVVVLVILALLFATVIERPVEELQRRRVPRGLSILSVYAAILGVVVLASILVAPMIGREATRFRDEAPQQLSDLRDSWRTSGIPLLRGPGVSGLTQVIEAIESPPPPPQELAIGVVTGIGGLIIGAITVFVMAFYYLMEKALLRRLILGQFQPGPRDRVNRIWDKVEAQVGRWLRGQITLCLVIGVASTIGYGLMGVRFWPLLGLWAGITEAIPIIGPWIGGIPAVIMALTESWEKAILVTGFVLVLQASENWILVPRIMRGAVGLTPLTVLVAILAGTQFMHFIGAFLAIPIAAVIQVITSEYLRTRREAIRLPESQLTGWRWMREQVQQQLTPEPEPPDAPAPAEPSATQGAPAPAGWRNQALARIGGRLGRSRLAGDLTPAETEAKRRTHSASSTE
jgi:predicted PurR-regulated permease PerM